MRLTPALLLGLLFAPSPASADTIAIVVRVEVPVVCNVVSDGRFGCNRKNMPPASDTVLRLNRQAGSGVIVRSIAP